MSFHLLRQTKNLSASCVTRNFWSSLPAAKNPAFPNLSRPGPPPLPLEDQKEFEELVRKAQAPLSGSQPDAAGPSISEKENLVHPDARQKPTPEFTGEVNPKTGERGGPKTEPLAWGASGEWTFGGRATDF